MKKIIFIMLLLQAGLNLKAQNIIPNPNFALRTGCPAGYGQIYLCNLWYRPTLGTPDYFNACDASPYYSVPFNSMGHQNTLSGAMTGIICYSLDTNYREYLGTSFPALSTGNYYRVSIVVSRGDICHIASDGLGVLFSTDTFFDTATGKCLHLTPQINYSHYGIITDSIGWVTLTDTLYADSAYTNLIIGNFKNDSAIHMIIDSSFGVQMSYYYIDSVAVEKISNVSVETMQADAGVHLYPNPFSDAAVMILNNAGGQPYTLNIYDVSGKLVRRQESKSETMYIYRGNLLSGTYHYLLMDSNGIKTTGKLTIL
jgi:hypothetical protein